MYEVKRINPLSLAKIQAAVTGIIYLIFVAFAILVQVVMFGFGRYGNYSLMGFWGPILGMIAFVVGAVIFGFILGLIGGYIYNWVAEWIGGVKMDLVLHEGETNNK